MDYNRTIASHRASVERVIAHLKNWKLLATGYRGLQQRFLTYLDSSPSPRSTEHHDH